MKRNSLPTLSQVAAETKRIQATARALAALMPCSFHSLKLLPVVVSCRPVMHDGDEIEIVQGRHPVIEVFNEDPFIPNSLYLNNSTDRLLIITGPNMGGKAQSYGKPLSSVCWRRWVALFPPKKRACLA